MMVEFFKDGINKINFMERVGIFMGLEDIMKVSIKIVKPMELD